MNKNLLLKKNHVSITGCNGYLGFNLAKFLLSNNVSVTAICHSKQITSSLVRLNKLKNFNYISVKNKRSLIKNLSNTDCLIHTAVVYGKKNESDYFIRSSNIDFPFYLFKIASLCNMPLFFNCSSFFEQNRYGYMNKYTESKLEFKDLVKRYNSRGNVKIIDFYLHHIFGPDESISKFTGWLFYELKKKNNIIKLSPGSQLRDFIYIKDIVRAMKYILFYGSIDYMPNKIEIGTGVKVSLKEFVCLLHKVFKSESKLLFGANDFHYGELKDINTNPEFLYSIGWKPKFSIKQAGLDILNNQYQLKECI